MPKIKAEKLKRPKEKPVKKVKSKTENDVVSQPQEQSQKPEKQEKSKPQKPTKKSDGGLRTKIRCGEITAKEALRRVKKFEFVHPKTLKWYTQRAAKEN